MQDRANGDSEEKSVGEISDRDEQQPQDERRAVQRRTFTRWMNVFLQRRDPPLEVHDLFTDIQDGRILMALLEELTGCKLLYRFRSSSHRIFRLNNISKALAFLDDRHVKLLGIDASGIADGIPSVVLNLLWNIILYFQVKEATRGLKQHLSSSLSSLSTSSYPSSGDLSPQPNDIGSFSCSTLPTKGRKAAREPKYHGKAIKTLLQWVQRCTSKFGVEVLDFGKSWRSGLAILAVIKSLNPALVDLRESLSREPRENLELAFMIAHQSLDIPALLEPEDMLCASPDEKSIITYMSMFLRHCSGTHEGCTTDIEVFTIPNFGSLDSVHFGETLADDTEAKALLKGFEKSSEQLLWKRWARRPSGSTSATSPRISGAVTSDESITEKLTDTGPTSPFNKKRSRCRSVFKPPSPLDACVLSQEIRSWMEKASADYSYSKPRVDESHLSLSSEEGIYSLTALDSDEEEAYSYILDLNKDSCQPYNQVKRQVPRVEEETAEEMFLNGQQTEESKHLEVCETLNFSGSKHKVGPLTENVESEARAQSVIQREFDENKSSSAEMANNRAAFDMEPKEESRNTGRCEEERAVREQSADDGDYCEEERHGYDKTKALIAETRKTKPFEVACWKTELEAENESDLLEKCGQASEKTALDEEEGANMTTSEEERNRKLWKEKEDNAKKEVKENQRSVNLESFMEGTKEQTLIDEAVYEVRRACATGFNTTEEENDRKDTPSKMEDFRNFKPVITIQVNDRGFNIKKHKLSAKTATTKLKNDTNGGVHAHGGDSSPIPASQSFRERGFILQPLAASCDITPLELEMLLVLWILLYCCFILL